MRLRSAPRLVAAVAASLALGACDTQGIGQGYSIKFADRGKAWIQSPDGTITDGDTVLSVWSDDEVVVYQVRGDASQDCEYRMIRKADGAPGTISREQAAEMVRQHGAKLQTSSSSSCPVGSTRR